MSALFLPVPAAPADLQGLLRRLAIEDQERRRRLAHLEDRVRRFEDVERPAYEAWLRLEIGPLFAKLAERSEELRARQILAQRVMELVEHEGLQPREALYVVTEASPGGTPEPGRGWSRAEIEARRRAKLEGKRQRRRKRQREAREQTCRERRGSSPQPSRGDASGEAPAADTRANAHANADGEAPRARVTELYRALARRLHPDSPTVIASLNSARVRTIWVEVQAAYAARSLERMLAISAWLETVGEVGRHASATAEGWQPAGTLADPMRFSLLSLAERHERLRALGRSCKGLERRLAQLEREPGWGFESAPVSGRRRLKQTATRRLENELVRLGEELQALEAFFEAIGSPRPPRPTRKR